MIVALIRNGETVLRVQHSQVHVGDTHMYMLIQVNNSFPLVCRQLMVPSAKVVNLRKQFTVGCGSHSSRHTKLTTWVFRRLVMA
jgi:hypothetical protein